MEYCYLNGQILPFKEAKFWEPFRNTPAWEFERFLDIADRGKPYVDEPWEKGDEARREREALDESLGHLKKILGRS